MSSTYSINPGTITEAEKLSDINSVLNELPDNTSKLITPKDVRDAVYTNWENIIFKPTTISSSNIEYVGIDQVSFKEIVYLGKKQRSGQNIMSDTLLNSDVDFFFYNMKSDSNTNQNTKISLLAGTNSALYSTAPYLYSNYVIAASGSYIDLTIKNPSLNGGNINIVSDYGYVTINGILFPTVANTAASASNGYVLRYRNGIMNWEDITSSINLSTITSSGTVSISGSPVFINGRDVNFTESTPLPVSIGGLTAGMTFSSVPLTELIREFLYPYLYPLSSLSLNTSLVEVGNVPSITLSYTITKRTNNVTSASLPNSGFSVSLPITSSTSSSTTGTVISGNTLGTQTWNLNVSDGTQGYTASAILNRIFPYFYGTSTTATSSITGINGILSGLTKLISTQGNISALLSGSNVCIYFAYPSSYPDLTSIIDNNGFDATSSFTKYSLSLNSPSGYWSSINYKVYVYTGGTSNPKTTSVGVYPSYTIPVTYQFKY